jgi:hypothetical protein
LHPVIITSDQARLLKISSEQTPGVTIGCSPSLPVDQGSPSIPSTSSNRFYSSFSPSSIWSFSTPQNGRCNTSFGSSSYIDRSLETSFARLRHSTSLNTSTVSDGPISDSASLNRFVREQTDIENHYQRTMSLSPQQQHISFDSSDLPPLGRYQPGVLSPSPSMREEDDSFGHSAHRSDEIWQRFKISKTELELWTDNLREWIAATIVKQLVAEIDNINKTLTGIGSRDIQIGSVGLSSLRYVATMKSYQVPSLAVTIPYLEVSTNQEYLVQRIKDLSHGDCLNCFRWNNGGQWMGRQWDSELPNDTQVNPSNYHLFRIVIEFSCRYYYTCYVHT